MGLKSMRTEIRIKYDSGETKQACAKNYVLIEGSSHNRIPCNKISNWNKRLGSLRNWTKNVWIEPSLSKETNTLVYVSQLFLKWTSLPSQVYVHLQDCRRFQARNGQDPLALPKSYS